MPMNKEKEKLNFSTCDKIWITTKRDKIFWETVFWKNTYFENEV